MRNLLRVGLTGVTVAGLSLSAGTATATPGGPGVTGRIVTQTTVAGTDYILREITVPPGESTGWHFHDGPLLAYVKQGTLSHFGHTCQSDGVYRAGSVVTEPSGAGNVHIGRNLGTIPIVLEALYVLPHGKPLSEDAPNPGCDFQ
ncbi:cupin domain-containing protein [Streptomyces sp. NPDC006923]|uniref:cupin domain-containing protein n=1 Tax=Streptomyces sp. NPDC006923 TaxID=3155355 RepID=UPI0033E3DD9A